MPQVQVLSPRPRRSKVRFAPTYFFTKISHPPAFLLLLFREKSRSVCLLVCKRTRDGSHPLPTFHDIALSAQPKSPAATVFAGKSYKNIRSMSWQAFWLIRVFIQKYGFTVSAAAPLLQKSPFEQALLASADITPPLHYHFLRYCVLGSPVRLQSPSERFAIATNCLRFQVRY